MTRRPMRLGIQIAVAAVSVVAVSTCGYAPNFEHTTCATRTPYCPPGYVCDESRETPGLCVLTLDASSPRGSLGGRAGPAPGGDVDSAGIGGHVGRSSSGSGSTGDRGTGGWATGGVRVRATGGAPASGVATGDARSDASATDESQGTITPTGGALTGGTMVSGSGGSPGRPETGGERTTTGGGRGTTSNTGGVAAASGGAASRTGGSGSGGHVGETGGAAGAPHGTGGSGDKGNGNDNGGGEGEPLPGHCDDGKKNGDETAVDCGGKCKPCRPS